MDPMTLQFLSNPNMVNLVRDVILPWKKKYGSKIDNLMKEKKNAEEAIVAHCLSRIELQDQGNRIKELDEKMKTIEQLLLEFKKEQASLALKIVESVNPDLPDDKKMEFALGLLEPIDILTNGSTDILEDVIDMKNNLNK